MDYIINGWQFDFDNIKAENTAKQDLEKNESKRIKAVEELLGMLKDDV